MTEFNNLVGEFVFPFPAKVFEKELNDAKLEFKAEFIPSSEGAYGSCIYYVKNEDFDKAVLLKGRIEKENAESELKYTHPFVKILPYLALILFVVYMIFKYLIK